MDVGRHIQIFDLIAPVYSWFFTLQVRNYRRIIANNPSFFKDCDCQILDIGCGTGALAYVLSESGHAVTGLDGSAKMIAKAIRLNKGGKAQFQVGNALELLQNKSVKINAHNLAGDEPITGQQYDIVVASYVLHGLQKDQRQKLYDTMKQLALKRVIIMDYNQRRSILTSAIEWLEHGDYFNFIKLAEAEMKQIFPNVQIVQTGKRQAWYVCECDHEDHA